MASPLLELDGICFRPGGRTVLDGIGLAWSDASICALIGPNGAGKTVTLRIAHGLLRPDAGRVRFEGREPPADDTAFEGQALVFQHPSLFRGSVLDNLLLARHACGLPKSLLRERALAMLERVGLSALADAPALKLSGGERQRVAIARAWLTGPRLLLLDEPTAALDPAARESIEALIREIAASGCRVLMTSHNLGQVARLADEVLFLSAGRLLERGRAQDFFRAPRTREAQRFLQGELPWQPAAIPAS
ncbi:ATP-binding cassette domain-containing protein [Burkholderiaceae bacterium FT117]|uniref:ABC transporter ATP-binding protein n=1 Tax=Zeimonas sediminis TaxID=2944268 RepID=UPI002342DFA2|nr:ATP-binding cassette domain-containing protein [Zeimonas sediminis]MCM5569392.1 ATP-binding cassette domain-containing protein [Zeimonas sediminis]